MLDFTGKELNIGDDVVFTEYNRHGLTRGNVVGFAKGLNMVQIEYSNESGHTKKIKKTSGYVIKVEK